MRHHVPRSHPPRCGALGARHLPPLPRSIEKLVQKSARDDYSRSMHNYLPSLKQMQYLVALHEHGHFGRAADACNVTQSTLSAGIRELETLLGQTLVERTRRVVRFTALGNAIVEKAHRVLREAEELADM